MRSRVVLQIFKTTEAPPTKTRNSKENEKGEKKLMWVPTLSTVSTDERHDKSVWFPISFLNETIPQFRPPSGRQVAADRTTVGARCVKRTAHRVVSADGAHPIERILPADGAAAALAAHHLGTLGA